MTGKSTRRFSDTLCSGSNLAKVAGEEEERTICVKNVGGSQDDGGSLQFPHSYFWQFEQKWVLLPPTLIRLIS